MRRWTQRVGYLLWVGLLLFVQLRLLSIYRHDQRRLSRLTPSIAGPHFNQNAQVCSLEAHMTALTQASDAQGVALLTLSFSDPGPCGVKGARCYPMHVVWEANFRTGRALVQAYQARCPFFLKELKINRIAYPSLRWELSGWAFVKGAS